MSRHNRRRTRGGHLQKNITVTSNIPSSNNHPGRMPGSYSPVYVQGTIQAQPSYLPSPPGLQPLWPSSPSYNGTVSLPPSAKHPPLRSIAAGPRTGISARHWHNRYAAWQAREKRQREELLRLEAEKCRIFGESAKEKDGYTIDAETEGDEELCEKMLEYFGGLDFIEW